MKRELKRINVNFPVEVVDRLDEYAERMAINRTSAISILLIQALDSQKTMANLDDLVKLIKTEQEKVSEN